MAKSWQIQLPIVVVVVFFFTVYCWGEKIA